MTMNKKLIVYWNGIVKIDNEHNIIRDDGMLQRILDTIASLEAADKEIALTEQHLADAMSVINKQGHEIATLKAQPQEDEHAFTAAYFLGKADKLELLGYIGYIQPEALEALNRVGEAHALIDKVASGHDGIAVYAAPQATAPWIPDADAPPIKPLIVAAPQATGDKK